MNNNKLAGERIETYLSVIRKMNCEGLLQMLKKVRIFIVITLTMAAMLLTLTACKNGNLEIDIKIKNQEVSVFADLIKDYSAEQAIDFYNENIKNDTALSDEAARFIEAYYKYIENYVYSDQCDLENAEKMLDTIDTVQGSVNVPGVDQAALRKAINDGLLSKRAFDNGNGFFEDKQYAEAIWEYQKVSERDSNYRAAQKRITDAKNEYSATIVSVVDELISEKSYLDAIAKINEVEFLTPNKIDFKDKLAECINAFVDAEIKRADDLYAAESDTEAALQIIKSAQQQFPESEKLKEREDHYSSIVDNE